MSAVTAAPPNFLEIGKPLPEANVVIWNEENNQREVVRLSSLLGEEKKVTCIISMPGAFFSSAHMQDLANSGSELANRKSNILIITTDRIDVLKRWKKDFEPPNQYCKGIDRFTMVSDCQEESFGKISGLLMKHPILGSVFKRAAVIVQYGIVASVSIDPNVDFLSTQIEKVTKDAVWDGS